MPPMTVWKLFGEGNGLLKPLNEDLQERGLSPFSQDEIKAKILDLLPIEVLDLKLPLCKYLTKDEFKQKTTKLLLEILDLVSRLTGKSKKRIALRCFFRADTVANELAWIEEGCIPKEKAPLAREYWFLTKLCVFLRVGLMGEEVPTEPAEKYLT